MTPPKSYWRQTPASDEFAASPGNEYESLGSSSSSSTNSSSLHRNEHNLTSKMARTRSNGTKSRRSKTVDTELEDSFHNVSDEDSKQNSRKNSKTIDQADRLVKRRDQNRVSQRAFRQRKERHTKELEAKVEELENQLDNASHENSIVHSQMGRMEEELRYYRRLLFAGASRNRLGLSPSSSDSSGSLSFTSNQFRGTRFDPSALQTSDFHGSPAEGQTTTPYVTSGHFPASTETSNTSFGTVRHSAASNNSCSTGDQTPARSCSPDSPNPFLPSQSSPDSPVITSPIPSHPTIDDFNINEDGSLWGLDISTWDMNNDPTRPVTRSLGIPAYTQYLPLNSADWTGHGVNEQW